MTETSWVDEEYRASDLWCVEKSITPLGDEEQLGAWRQAVSVLGRLSRLAEVLSNDPLLLALTDALVRAEEERARLEDKLSQPEGEELHSREHHRLEDLMHRADALQSALGALESDEWPVPGHRAEYEKILGEMHREAYEAFARYRSEVGVRSN